jgi:four helix bundle protein
MENTIKSFEDLECWKACRRLRLYIVKNVIPILPVDEKYRLADQLIRAGRSTTANIAEGYGKYRFLDNRKYCGIARGSCQEVIDHLIAANDEEMLPDLILNEGRAITTEAIRLLNGYMAYLKRAESES